MVRTEHGTVLRLGEWTNGEANKKRWPRRRKRHRPEPYRVLLGDPAPGDPHADEIERRVAEVRAEPRFAGAHHGAEATGTSLLAQALILSAVAGACLGRRLEAGALPRTEAPRRRRLISEGKWAERWLLTEGARGPITFDNCCELLEADPDFLRQAIRLHLVPPTGSPLPTGEARR